MGLAKPFSRVARGIRRDGVWETVQKIPAIVEDLWFDWRFGTETRKYVELSALQILSANKELGVWYSPTRVRAIRMLMRHLDLPQGRLLVDFGCGKGRVLLAAASGRFRRIVGVEFARELCEICRQNVAVFQARFATDTVLKVVESDAVEYRIADDEDVFFFFNPFLPPVMEKALQNIQRSVQSQPRTIWLILNNPESLAPAVDAQGCLRKSGEFKYAGSLFFVYSNNADGIP